MRKLVWFTIGFAAACGLCIYLLPNSWIVPLIAGSLLCAVGFGWGKLRRAAFVCVGFMIGLVWFVLFQRWYLLPAMELDAGTVEATVTVTDYSYETTYGTAVDGRLEISGKPYSIRVYINDKKELKPGDVISGEFKMRYTASGAQEDATYHSGEGILLLGYQRGSVEIVEAVKADVRFYSAILARQIKDRLLPEDVFPFAQALLLGDNSELDYETDTAFKISGIRHIIAVSGLHVTILYSLISTLAFRKRYLTAVVCLPVLVLFAAVAGFTPSVTRACIMVGLMVLAQVFRREYDSPTALAFAALVMLIWNPLVFTSVGFQLTVGCVAGIQLFNAPVSEWLKSKLGSVKGRGVKAKLLRWFISSVSVTLSAMSLTTPLSAYYFGTVSIVGVVTNLLTLWVVNLLFNGLVVICVVSLVSLDVAAVIGSILAWAARYVLWMAKGLSSFPLASVYTKSPYIVAWLVFVYVLLAVFLLSHKKKPLTLCCCGALGLLLALTVSWAEPLLDETRMTVLDVGQGQSILLQSEGKTFLVDCGGDSDTMTADIVAETLLSQGVSKLDGIILTHADRDHAGAVTNLLSRVQTDLLLLPATIEPETAAQIASAAEGEVVYVDEDVEVTFGNTEMTIFGPLFVAESNENSLCVLFATENCDILITGDRGALGEMMLLREKELPKVDVLIAGHHGSKYSTSEQLLQAVRPDVVIISAGEDNAYGHPAQETLDRLENYGCRVYRTDISGTIIYRR